MVTVYGLKNCDTCRKALKWLAGRGLAHRFLDVRADGIDEARIAGWVRRLGWEQVLNRRSATWRGLADADRAGLDGARAAALMAAHPALVKRPVFEIEGAAGGSGGSGGAVLVGFGEAEKKALAAAGG